MREYTNNDRWRHIKHFVDTHRYSRSNLEYLKNWLEHFKSEEGVPLPSNPTPTEEEL